MIKSKSRDFRFIFQIIFYFSFSFIKKASTPSSMLTIECSVNQLENIFSGSLRNANGVDIDGISKQSMTSSICLRGVLDLSS